MAKTMIFARVDVAFRDHIRAGAAGEGGRSLWLWGLLYARGQETDGFLPEAFVRGAWGESAEHNLELAERLVAVGLWERVDGGWTMLRYADHNETKAEIEDRRAKERRKKKDQRERDFNNLRRVSPGESPGDPRGIPDSDSDSGSGKRDQEAEERDRDARARAAPPPSAPRPVAPPTAPPGAQDGPGSSRLGPTLPPGPPPPADAAEGPPGRTAPPSSPPASSSASGRAPRPLHVRRLEQGAYAYAFASGVRAATGIASYAVPRDELAALDDAIDAHAPMGPAEDRSAWIEASASAFRVAIARRENFHKAGGPRGWLEWLNVGAPSAKWLAMTPAERDEHDAEEKRRARAAERRSVERARRAAEPTEAPFDPSAAAREGLPGLMAKIGLSAARALPPPLPEPADDAPRLEARGASKVS